MLSESMFQVISIDEAPKGDLIVSGKRPVIMVVDVEKILADTLALILTKSGFYAKASYDGVSALVLAQEIRPQLMITDVVMPKMTGVELAIAMAGIIPDCKILLFSGQAATADLLRHAGEPGHNFTTLSKPIHPTDLLRQVKEHLLENQLTE